MLSEARSLIARLAVLPYFGLLQESFCKNAVKGIFPKLSGQGSIQEFADSLDGSVAAIEVCIAPMAPATIYWSTGTEPWCFIKARLPGCRKLFRKGRQIKSNPVRNLFGA